jgi:hypothetical protein
MNTAAGQGVEIGRHCRNQCFALAGLHLSDVAQVERGAAHHLDIEVPLVQDPVACFAYGCEGLRQQRLERLALVEARPQVAGLATQLLVTHCDKVVFDRIHLFGDVRELLEKFAFA